MPNITLSIPDEIYKFMKQHNEIRWTAIARKAFEKYINRIKAVDMMEYDEKIKFLDNLLENSELTEEDIMDLDEKIKDGLSKRIQAELK
jgi:hypothetical protein